MGAVMLNLQTLVLNADFRPLSYNPLSLWSWRDAMTALMLDRVQLVANYDVHARSPRISYPVPSVVALKRYKKLDGFPAFTRAWMTSAAVCPCAAQCILFCTVAKNCCEISVFGV